ncbi:hypothetical protein Q5752_000945 [Cryptotrichosporon argae]
MLRVLYLFALGALALNAAALGVPNVLEFAASAGSLTLASADAALPILLDSTDAEALHIAARTFAEDVLRVVGVKPEIYVDTLPAAVTAAIVVATVGSALLGKKKANGAAEPNGHAQIPLLKDTNDALEGKWESYDVRVEAGLAGTAEALVVKGSDARGAIFALYTLSEHFGVSPWYWWADVPAAKHAVLAFPRAAVLAHGEPTVKYRGFFLNDEQPVLWNWAATHFGIAPGQPPFQAAMYEKVFELVLRLRGNYMWPAMWASMFAVDGSGVVDDVPSAPEPGPNQALAARMGVVMGTSHHEPMARNQREFTVSHAAAGAAWDYEKNPDWLDAFWKFGAERARRADAETVFTVGMRGDGDLPLDGANVKLLEKITARQQEILKEVYPDKPLKDIPQMWAMYKEVMGYFANGLEVPDEVTALLCDDNWGNLMAVLPAGRVSSGGGGIYYHADYVGDPRSYKWTNTVPLAKMWEQLTVAHTFRTDKIWICNVGDLKNLETPLEYFMDLGYDLGRWGRDSLLAYLREKAERDFGLEDGTETAEIMAKYSILASRRKAELLDSNTYSIVSYSEAERSLADWAELETRARAVHGALPDARKTPFYEMVLSPVLLNANLNRLYTGAARSNLYATQARTAANVCARDALDCFERDQQLTDEYHALEGGKWGNMLVQPHINYQYWQGPMRNSMPPVSFVTSHTGSYPTGQRWGALHTRFTVSDCRGAWPGDNKFNCPLGYACPDPTLLPMDRWGRARWVDVGSGGNRDVAFTVVADQPWVVLSTTAGTITGDGKNDARVTIGVDWDAFDTSPADEAHVTFDCTDHAHMVVTVPIVRTPALPAGFKGAVQGDGYVAIEAAHFQAHRPAIIDSLETAGGGAKVAQTHEWAEIPFYGRTLSGLAVLPHARFDVAPAEAPSVTYDFFVHAVPAGPVEVNLHVGPSLNFFLGTRLALGVQLDAGDVKRIEPIPEAKLGDLPADWEHVVANEIREVKTLIDVTTTGKHSLTVYGLTAGVVLERVLLDFGGIAARDHSYLGPPESVIV